MSSKKSPAVPAKSFIDAAPESGIVHPKECIVCAEYIDGDSHLHTVSVCGHPETICSLCFFRIRSLQHNFNCPTCKRQLDNVICVPDSIIKYEEFNLWGDNIDGYHYDEPSKMFFPTEYFQKHISKLRQYQCRLCNQSRRDFKQLKGHYFGEHQKHLCQLCHDNKQIFPAELVCYDQATYEKHIRHGDGDGSVGHPNCEFCRTRFYDSHALFIHLSREHYTCHICEQLGLKFKYFHSYQHLETHFRKDHIICEDPACLERRFVVFSNEFDFAAHNRQYHPHLAAGRGVQIRFNYKGGASGGSTPTPNDASSGLRENDRLATDNPEYVSRAARFEGGLGGRAQNGEWQVEIQAMSRDPRDPNRHTARNETVPTVASSANTTSSVQEEFPTLAATMGTSASLGPQKWMNARSDGVNQLQTKKRTDDFPALPSSNSGKHAKAFNSNSLVKSNAPIAKSNGTSSKKQGPSASASAVVTGGSAKVPRSMGLPTEQEQEDWNTTTGNYSYECDLSAAISASLAEASLASASRPITAKSRNTSATQLGANNAKSSSEQSLEEAFPALGGGVSSKETSEKKKPAVQQKPKLSSDLMNAMKLIGADPNKKKKKAGTGLTVVKTLKPKSNDNDSAPSPPPPTMAATPPPVAFGRVATNNNNNTGIGKGPSWGRSYGGFGNNDLPPAPSTSSKSNSSVSASDFPSLR